MSNEELARISLNNKKKIFIEIVNSNLNILKNEMICKTTDFFFDYEYDLNDLTNEEIVNLAVDFFNKELSSKVLEENETKVNGSLKKSQRINFIC